MSDFSIPSTPPAADNAVLSDQAIDASSPPSSPPGFPWEQQDKTGQSTLIPQKPVTNAFSILGKRKALEPVTNNALPTKKSRTKPSQRSTNAPTQMQISAGQEVQKRCRTCGMEYIVSSAEDRKLHDTYHKQNEEGYDVGKLFIERTDKSSLLPCASDGEKKGEFIVAVSTQDEPWRRKRAKAALEIVQRELGAVDIPEKELWSKSKTGHPLADEDTGRYTFYMYIRGTRCVGLLLVEQITEARAVLPTKAALKAEAEAAAMRKKKSALSELQARQHLQTTTKQTRETIEIALDSSPATLGISRIWTCSTYRCQGIALRLLNAAIAHQSRCLAPKRENENSKTKDSRKGGRTTISLDQVAFSQPTEYGARLARGWFGKRYGWKVYPD